MVLPARADVVVVGAGIAGLVGAGRLQQAGLDVVMVEAADAVGGRIRSDVVDGFVLDRGFQLLNPAYPEAKHALDLDALDLQSFPPGVVACAGEDRYALGDPLRLPATIRADLTAPIGSLREKLAAARWIGSLGLRSGNSIRAATDRPLADELDARGVGGLTEQVLQPFLSGVLADPELASSQRMASMLLRSFARGTPGVPARGMQAIPDQLAARLQPGSLHLGVRARSVTTGSVDTDAGGIAAPVVVVAVNGDSAAALGAPGSSMRALTTWWYAADERPSDQALLHVDSERRGPLASTVVMTNAAPSYSADGRALIGATAVGAHPDGELAARRHAGLLYGVDPTAWQLLRTDVIEHALPAHPPGQPLQRRVALGDGLFVTGDHRDTPSIQGALVSGRRVADAVLASVGQPATS